jgi:hypothetical protein
MLVSLRSTSIYPDIKFDAKLAFKPVKIGATSGG